MKRWIPVSRPCPGMSSPRSSRSRRAGRGPGAGRPPGDVRRHGVVLRQRHAAQLLHDEPLQGRRARRASASRSSMARPGQPAADAEVVVHLTYGGKTEDVPARYRGAGRGNLIPNLWSAKWTVPAGAPTGVVGVTRHGQGQERADSGVEAVPERRQPPDDRQRVTGSGQSRAKAGSSMRIVAVAWHAGASRADRIGGAPGRVLFQFHSPATGGIAGARCRGAGRRRRRPAAQFHVRQAGRRRAGQP